MANYALILAGGIGSRFWPLSTETDPKQFLNIRSEKSMLEETVERVCPLIPRQNIYLAVNIRHREKISPLADRLGIAAENILFEPESRNTFPPIAVLSQRIESIDKDSIISVLPCDHIIKNNEKFRESLSDAIEASRMGNIIAFGIRPKRPETGYGYIKVNSRFKMKNSKLYKVEKFIEKPDFKKAKRFIKHERYYWNSGIFVFSAGIFLNEIKKMMPRVYRSINTPSGFDELWQGLPATSIDYAIMEKTGSLILLPVEYGWVDLGSWQAIAEISKKDRQENIFKGNSVDLGSKNSIVWATDNRIVASIGLKDIIIVDGKDALLVCAKDRTQDVKKIVGKLNKL